MLLKKNNNALPGNYYEEYNFKKKQQLKLRNVTGSLQTSTRNFFILWRF